MRRLVLFALVIVGVVLIGSVALGFRSPFTLAPRSSSKPTQPHILYLAPSGITRGLVTEASLLANGATPVYDWQAAEQVGSQKAIDALLVDVSLLANVFWPDEAWLRTQFQDGVVIVGLGADDDLLAAKLGVVTLQDPNELDLPADPLGFIAVYQLILATPDDLPRVRGEFQPTGSTQVCPSRIRSLDALNCWFRYYTDRSAKRVTRQIDNSPVQNYASTSAGRFIGRVDNPTEIRLLFLNLHNAIDGMYQSRTDFAAHFPPTPEPSTAP